MGKLIDLDAYPVRISLKILLQDKTTKKNIIWATDAYKDSVGAKDTDQIEMSHLIGMDPILLQPRISKAVEEQQERTRKKAEVFTPVWICNQMNNHLDEEWFGRKDVFNIEGEQTWTTVDGPVSFPEKKIWKHYVDSRRLEITCGEAPYLVSRYDTVTWDTIELAQRIGLLDRKMRVAMENTETEEAWRKWATIAFQSIYGFDWQGDNVLFARENLLLSYVDYYISRFEKEPDTDDLRMIAEILSWNIWQMDGLKFVIPNSCKDTDSGQLQLFDDEPEKRPCEGCAKNDPLLHTGIYCMIMDWKENKKVKFVSLLKNGARI